MSIATLDEAQIAVVGSILIDADCLGDVLTRVRAEDFVYPRYRAIFEAARDLYIAGAPVDQVLIMNRCGGEAIRETVVTCMDLTPTAANVLYYCDVLREQSALYRIRIAAETLAEAKTLDQARDILAKAQTELAARPTVQVMTLAELMGDFMRRVGSPKPEYLHWGLGMLDAALHVDDSKYLLLGARPSTGKTAMALQLGINISKKRRVGFFSLETPPKTAGDRIAAANLPITLPAIQERRVTLTDLEIFARQLTADGVFGKSLENFEFVSAAGMTVPEIRTYSLARRYDVIFIDYVQLLRSSIRGDMKDRMQDVSMSLRAMAQATGIVIVALAQLKRPEGKEKSKLPSTADLKESGQFEQDADVVMLMSLMDPDNQLSDRRLQLAKNKEGYVGFYSRFQFDGRKQRFTYVDKDGKPIEDKPKFQEDEQLEMEELPEGWKQGTR